MAKSANKKGKESKQVRREKNSGTASIPKKANNPATKGSKKTMALHANQATVEEGSPSPSLPM